jgi:hypothetical protein
MVNSITVKYFENGTFEKITVFADRTFRIEIFDVDNILLSCQDFLSYPPKIITDMLKNIKPRQQLQLQTYEDDADVEFVDARQFFWSLIRKHNN